MSFPLTGILDNATRADENPLSNGGLWANATMQAGDFKLKLVTNTIQSAGASQGSQYTAARHGPDCEMYVTTTTVDGGVDLIGRLNSPNSGSQTGYWVAFDIPGDAVSIYRLIGTTIKTVLLTTKSGITIVTGDQLGFRMVEETIQAFVNGAEVLRVVDDGFRAAGNLAINQFSNQSPITSVGGGTLATGLHPDDLSSFPAAKVLVR